MKLFQQLVRTFSYKDHLDCDWRSKKDLSWSSLRFQNKNKHLQSQIGDTGPYKNSHVDQTALPPDFQKENNWVRYQRKL